MDSNFYEDFKTNSNEELISVIRQIGAHQPEAIAAAYKHLNERQVSDSEIFGLPAASTSADTAGANEDGQEDLLVPYLQETTVKSSNKWINIILSVIASQFFYQTIYTGWYFYKNNLNLSLLFNYSYIVPFFFVPILFLLVFKRKKWGWNILFAIHIINIIVTIGLHGRGLISGLIDDLSTLIGPVVVLAVSTFMVSVLWKEEVARDFVVSKAKKQQAAMVAGVLGIFILFTRFNF
jgi:hypothetical protein